MILFSLSRKDAFMRRLVLCLCLAMVGAVPARGADALSPAQTKAVERIVHDYLVKHPNGYTCHFLRPESVLGN